MEFPTFFNDLPITRRALEFAAARHTGQRRAADQAPFILHPLEVAQLLRGREYPDEVVAAGVLHDVIEDAGVGHAELEERFGQHVAALVSAVTEPTAEGDYRERKAALRDSVANAEPDAVAIYAADKVAKLRDRVRRPCRGQCWPVLDGGDRDEFRHCTAAFSAGCGARLLAGDVAVLYGAGRAGSRPPLAGAQGPGAQFAPRAKISSRACPIGSRGIRTLACGSRSLSTRISSAHRCRWRWYHRLLPAAG